jgi:hypothetical protein
MMQKVPLHHASARGARPAVAESSAFRTADGPTIRPRFLSDSSPGNESAYAAPTAVVQRVIKIGDKTYRPGNKPPRHLLNDDHKRAMWHKMIAEDTPYSFDGKADFHKGMEASRKRKTWETEKSRNGSLDLNRLDPEFQRIRHEVKSSHDDRPYSIDALHEGGSLMSSYTHGSIGGMASALSSSSTWTGRARNDRPNFEITRIEQLKQEGLQKKYANAKKDIAKRTGDQTANEKTLYSGHGAHTTDMIANGGHRPDLGGYDPPTRTKGAVTGALGGAAAGALAGSIVPGVGTALGFGIGGLLGGLAGAYKRWGPSKGHGAHGRGAYFTDQVDKAVSYSGTGQNVGEERSFLRQNVLLGNAREYNDRGRFRQSHHDEMVRTKRNPGTNIRRVEGKAAPSTERMADYDSLIGRGTYQPGAGLIGTIRHSAQFDSDEYMVRNADQVLPRHRVHYRRTS